MVKRLSACNAGDPGLITGSGRSPKEGNGNPLQYSCLENSMDWRAWLATVHGVAKSWTQMSNFTFTFFPMLKSLLANAGDMGSIPSLGRFHMQHCNYWFCALESRRYNYWSPRTLEPLSPCSATRQATSLFLGVKVDGDRDWMAQKSKPPGTLEQTKDFEETVQSAVLVL